VVNRQGVGFVAGQMVDEAVARKVRRVLERAGVTAQDEIRSGRTSKQLTEREKMEKLIVGKRPTWLPLSSKQTMFHLARHFDTRTTTLRAVTK
jgi:hypothetical protein